MSLPSYSSLQSQYSGFLRTAEIFKEHTAGMDFFVLDKDWAEEKPLTSTFDIPDNIRLGQRMEYFMEEALNATQYKVIEKNLQIIHKKKTLGEIDFIVQNKVDQSIFQLEMVYKFYLFDPEVEGCWSEKWIGANRSDSLFLKLRKLKKKQLPLLHSLETKPYLTKIHLKSVHLGQKVSFKGQLFLPFNQEKIAIQNIDSKSIVGFWLRINEIDALYHSEAKILIPDKNDWVAVPSLKNSKWESFDTQRSRLQHISDINEGTLFWYMEKDLSLSRYFLVCWP
ncbi:MAG: DUF1853 family protein [Leeuwenhoekiella sp.]